MMRHASSSVLVLAAAAVLAAASAPAALAFYGEDSAVVELDPESFYERTTKSKHLWIVEFYAPWCGHCKQFSKPYGDAATTLKGEAVLAAVDATTETELKARFEVRSSLPPPPHWPPAPP